MRLAGSCVRCRRLAWGAHTGHLAHLAIAELLGPLLGCCLHGAWHQLKADICAHAHALLTSTSICTRAFPGASSINLPFICCKSPARTMHLRV